ncbi:hypothetical protein FC83_GL001525 [Agrilactobacillus composti DSM 18527 = JCM 14202]|uniref:Uncharacterized protein n=1 Tax=Agrilactobacillus composti DSM 18527 = JCM 14202 TaxID=1423734 RepID=X0PDB2_9LACO|nr:hypothetical protein [Agrilactobacillus composti]KRM30394.1 hypothetical protein FC83_GL001525 [Agrilactobacillus composti DSM 18527 = JCM 14202]GAF38863.1 hypothetical protein JCM14202_694 [Agrilactobacillus composti DSM 18527 = JCM 14202]
MVDKSDEVKLDPKEFAKLCVGNLPKDPNDDTERRAKKVLLQYLNGYYIAAQFNDYEKGLIDQGIEREHYLNRKEIVAMLSHVKWIQ